MPNEQIRKLLKQEALISLSLLFMAAGLARVMFLDIVCYSGNCRAGLLHGTPLGVLGKRLRSGNKGSAGVRSLWAPSYIINLRSGASEG